MLSTYSCRWVHTTPRSGHHHGGASYVSDFFHCRSEWSHSQLQVTTFAVLRSNNGSHREWCWDLGGRALLTGEVISHIIIVSSCFSYMIHGLFYSPTDCYICSVFRQSWSVVSNALYISNPDLTQLDLLTKYLHGFPVTKPCMQQKPSKIENQILCSQPGQKRDDNCFYTSQNVLSEIRTLCTVNSDRK